MVSYSGQVAIVTIVTIAYTAILLASVHACRAILLRERLLIAYVSIAWVIAIVTATVVIVKNQRESSGGLWTTTSWFDAGWDNGLSVFSIKVDTYWKYMLLVIYQVTRSVLGSLNVNLFRSYMMVEVQAAKCTKKETRVLGMPGTWFRPLLMGAQASYDIFSFYTSIFDSFTMLAQFDMTLIITVMSTAMDVISTMYFCDQISPPPQETRLDEVAPETRQVSTRASKRAGAVTILDVTVEGASGTSWNWLNTRRR